MKHLKFLILSLFALSLVYSCRSEEKYYDGETGLHFNLSEGSTQLVNTGETKTFMVNFGSMNEVSEDTPVTLVIDTDQSDAFPAGAIELLNGGEGIIPKGKAMGNVEVKLDANFLTTTPTKVVFKLQSASIENAVFKQTYTLYASQVCPISTFLGSFVNDEAWWWENPGSSFNILQGGTANELVIENFFDTGIHFYMMYDPATFVVYFEPQDTGYTHPSYGANIWARMKEGGTTSSLDPCQRELNLHIEYYIEGVGSYGEQHEHFTGE